MLGGFASGLLQQALAQQQEEVNRGLANIGQLSGLGGYTGDPARQQYLTSHDDRIKIKYKPTIEAGDNIRDVLQAETDDWLKEIK